MAFILRKVKLIEECENRRRVSPRRTGAEDQLAAAAEALNRKCNLLKEELTVDGRSDFTPTFRGLWSFCSCLRPLLRSGAT